MVCFRYITVNTLHKGDNRDKNNNNTLIWLIIVVPMLISRLVNYLLMTEVSNIISIPLTCHHVVVLTHPSIYGATARLGPCPPSEDTSILLSSACLLHPCIPSISDVSLLTTSSYLVLGFSTGLML